MTSKDDKSYAERRAEKAAAYRHQLAADVVPPYFGENDRKNISVTAIGTIIANVVTVIVVLIGYETYKNRYVVAWVMVGLYALFAASIMWSFVTGAFARLAHRVFAVATGATSERPVRPARPFAAILAEYVWALTFALLLPLFALLLGYAVSATK